MQPNSKILPIKLSFVPAEQNEGDGAFVRRIIGISQLKSLDPFLMLDHFNVRLPAGFPDHPHRGFATLTYLLSGGMYHEDFKGHKGVLCPGDIQVMTAGKGIIHAEMPTSFEEPAKGFQLWLNLKAEYKYGEADYQEFKAENIPTYEDNKGVKAKVIIGEYGNIKSVIKAKSPVEFIDFQLAEGAGLEKQVKKDWNSFLVVYEGSVKVGEKVFESENAVIFEKACGEAVISLKNNGKSCKFIFISGFYLIKYNQN